ncbi:MAG: hypothetical protein JKY37_29175 [Nannocystaceae bacterium]|nr:hypothetical protein [Nannocystaceae bacterium]
MSKLLNIRTAVRLTVSTTLAFSLVGLAGCKSGGGAKSAKLIPDAATIVGGVDLAGIQKSKLWNDHLHELVKAQGKDVLAAMDACGLGLDKWQSITIGGTDAGGGDKIALVAVADGLGKKETLECAHGKLKEIDGEEPWTVEEDGKVLKMDDGAMGYVIDDNTVVIAGKDWTDSVSKLAKGEGKSAFDGGLADVLKRTDTSKHIWFAGKVPEGAGTAAKEQLGAAPTDVAGYFDFSSGMEVKASIGVGSSDEAASVKEKVEGLFNGMAKGLAKAQGVSDDTLDNVKFDTDGNAFTIEAKASDADLTKAVEQAKGMLM